MLEIPRNITANIWKRLLSCFHVASTVVGDAGLLLDPEWVAHGLEGHRHVRILGAVQAPHAQADTPERFVPVLGKCLRSIGSPAVVVKTGVVGATCNGSRSRSTRTVSGSNSTVRRALSVFGSL